MATEIKKDKITEKAKFIQHHLPGLEDGEYLITVQNQLQSPDDPDKINKTEGKTTTLTYKFAVKGPRYSLDPSIVHAVFPPTQAGTYEQVLPHVTLTKKDLPWQRTPYKNLQDKGTFSYKDGNGTSYTYDQDVASWLAVLLLNDDDYGFAPANIDFKDAVQTGTVKDLIPQSGDHFISPLSIQGVTSDGSGLDVGENIKDPCTYVQIPVEVFQFIAPSIEDLKMMANVRQVDLSNKPTDKMTKVMIEQIEEEGSTADTVDMGTYSIVMGNRFPASGKRHLAVLISLEGMEDYLPADGGGTPKSNVPDGTTTYRLPVLKYWYFNNQAEKYSFDTILESLNKGTPGTTKLNQPQLQYYPDPHNSLPDAAKNALGFGYIPINHLTRALKAGIQTASWYRGPLSPVAVPTGIVNATQEGTMLIYHPDSLLRINPLTGLYDVSYAAAWQLGQLLALQDKTFSTMLYQWKQDSLIKLIQIIDFYLVTQNTDTLKDLEQGDKDDPLNADFYDGIIFLLNKMTNNQ